MTLLCLKCEARFEDAGARCRRCGQPLVFKGEAEVSSQRLLERWAGRYRGVWRYRELLPKVRPSRVVTLGEGGTPMLKAKRLSRSLEARSLYLKNESMNPTGSFIDRGSTVAVSVAAAKRVSRLVCVSLGNLGASVAAYAAKAGLACTVYTPSYVSPEKLHQAAAYGASVKLVEDVEEALSYARRVGGLMVGESDPYFLAGLKTTGFELAEALGWRSPDLVFVPVGDGGHLAMIWLGFKELAEHGVVDEVPRVVAVQPEGSAPVVEAFEQGCEEPKPHMSPRGVAEDLSPHPINGQLALKAMRESGGFGVRVEDGLIVEAAVKLARLEGIYAEPTAAVGLAGLMKGLSTGLVSPSDEAVCVITGSGLKDPYNLALLSGEPVWRLKVPKARLGRTKSRILELLYREPAHGYRLWLLLPRYGVSLKLPAVYQHLSELAEEGLVEGFEASSRGRRRKLYRLTERGRRLARALLHIDVA